MNKRTFTTTETIALALGSSAMTIAATYLVILICVIQPMKKEAVDRGFASWQVVNNATGFTVFAWNEIDATIHGANPNTIFDRVAEPLPDLSSTK